MRREDARAGAVKDKAQHKHGREEALEAQDRAIERKPNDPKKWKGKGWALYEIGRKEEALEAYDRALAIKPYNDGSLNGKVWTLSKLSL